jgi:hypothetical protein
LVKDKSFFVPAGKGIFSLLARNIGRGLIEACTINQL